MLTPNFYLAHGSDQLFFCIQPLNTQKYQQVFGNQKKCSKRSGFINFKFLAVTSATSCRMTRTNKFSSVGDLCILKDLVHKKLARPRIRYSACSQEKKICLGDSRNENFYQTDLTNTSQNLRYVHTNWWQHARKIKYPFSSTGLTSTWGDK